MLNFFSGILDINHSVLSGVMDIIVIQYPDGKLKSSPFHVRFGTLKILKTREKTINIYVNNIKTDLTMRLSSSGDAYFLQEVKKVKEEDEEIENNFSDGIGSPVNRRRSAPDSPKMSPFTNGNKEEEKMNDPSHIDSETEGKTTVGLHVPSIKVKENIIKSPCSDKVEAKESFKDSNTKTKKGIFKTMYNFITRNKSVDKEDLKKMDEKRNSLKNINLVNIEKEIVEQVTKKTCIDENNEISLSRIIPNDSQNPIEQIIDSKILINEEFKEITIDNKEKTRHKDSVDFNPCCSNPSNNNNLSVNHLPKVELKNPSSPNKLNDTPRTNIQFNINNLEDPLTVKVNPKDLQIIELSNCWNLLTKNPENIEEIFYKYLIPKEDFYKDPWKVLNNTNLVVRYEDSLYTWKAAAPLLISILAYGEVPNQSVMEPLLAKIEGGFMSYFIRSKPKKVDLLKIDVNKGRKTPKTLNNFHINEAVNSKEVIMQLEKIENKLIEEEQKSQHHPVKLPVLNASNKKVSVIFKKSFVPTSDQLKKLGLKAGRNEVRFTVTSRYQGTHSLITELYLWESDSKIVISDVDGTITRSDILGQLMPIFGKDWSHSGVTELFTNIEKNNYKIMYLTARAIGQSEQTKHYLRKLQQKGINLPRGPVLMSPDGIVSSFKREVIDKTPQFKIACLIEILNLFPEEYKPFYAGFGNRETVLLVLIKDAVSYRSVGIDLGKIFIINERGEITQLNNAYKKNYLLLNEIVHEMFPDLKGNNINEDGDYWKPKLCLNDLKNIKI